MMMMMTAAAATASQGQPPTDKGVDVAVPGGSDSLMKRKRSADDNGKQKKTRPALSGRIMTRSAFKQQQLEKEGLDVAAPGGSDSFLMKGKRSADDNGKQKKIGLSRSGRIMTLSEFRQQQLEEEGLDVVAPEGRDSLKKRKRAQNDGNGKQEISAFMRQQVERLKLMRDELERLMKKKIGFDFGDIPPIEGYQPGVVYNPCWAEKSSCPAPKVYEDMAKIGLKSYNSEFDTSYQFAKILGVYFTKTEKGFIKFYIFFQVEDKSVASPENFRVTVFWTYDHIKVTSCEMDKENSRYSKERVYYVRGDPNF